MPCKAMPKRNGNGKGSCTAIVPYGTHGKWRQGVIQTIGADVKRPVKAGPASGGKQGRVVRIGTDFSGLDAMVHGLRHAITNSGVVMTAMHVFACDKLRSIKKLQEGFFKPLRYDHDITLRDVNYCEYVDVYSFTAPCQSFSRAGKLLGVDDERGLLFNYCLQYIMLRKPKVVVSENVDNIVTMFREVVDFIVLCLQGAGYDVEWNILDSIDYHIPQRRKRWYMVAIRKDCKRTYNVVSMWPQKSENTLPLSAIIAPLPINKRKAIPDEDQPLMRANVLSAFNKCADDGVNPFKESVIVDTGSSTEFSSFRVGECMTLTRTRAGQEGGYWCSTKMGPLSVSDMLALQGFKERDIPWEEAGLSHHAIGCAIGNSQSVNVVTPVVINGMYMAKLISKDVHTRLLAACRALW